MKTSCAFVLAAAIGFASVTDASPSSMQDVLRIDYTPSPSCSVTACFTGRGSPPSARIRVADDYCTTRCYQQFKYCQYRRESFDDCGDRLKTCLARC